MPAISVSRLAWSKPDGSPVFTGLDLSFNAERVGLVGRNGTGKTTLLKIFASDLKPSAGSVSIHGRVATVRQAVQVGETETVADLFDVSPALAILRRAESGEARMDELAEADWTLKERMGAALSRVGLEASAETRLATLSGGQRTRAGLAAAVFAEPDFLLLDEPTNNLDRAGRAAVIALLQGWRSGAVVVSHDRELLEHMDAIVELTSLGASRYGGNWSAYHARKAVELQAAQQDLEHAEKTIAEVNRKAQLATERKERRDAAGARRGARGDMPKILLGLRKSNAEASKGQGVKLADRQRNQAMDAVRSAESRIEKLKLLSVSLPSTGLPASRAVLSLDHVSAGYDPEHPVIRNLSFSMVGPERVAVVGANGSGKTTLLKLITGALEPQQGRVSVHVNAAMLDQSVGILDPETSILDNFLRLNPGATENDGRATLASFLFRADAGLQMVNTLSGGQMLRAGLACVLGGPAPPALLILDEPTNHLDIQAIEAIEAGLIAYDGALLVVSHDETFLDAIGAHRRVQLD